MDKYSEDKFYEKNKSDKLSVQLQLLAILSLDDFDNHVENM